MTPSTTAPRNLRSIALVMAGGVAGAAAREAIEQALPPSNHGFPWATFAINLAGAFVLGWLIETLARSGGDAGRRHGVRLVGGIGFCGAFTTYSTLAMESVQLARHGAWATGAVYVLASVICGVLIAAAGVVIASRVRAQQAAP